MHKGKAAAFLLMGVLLMPGLLLAQSTASHQVTMRVNEIAVIAIAGGNIILTISPPDNGGDPPPNPSDNSTFAQYTSVVPPDRTRNITAHWAAGNSAPSGCELRLQAFPQGGNRGSSAGEIILSTTAQNIVTGIRSCATGRGPSDGARLNYTLVVTNVEQLEAGDERTATITLTLTDAN